MLHLQALPPLGTALLVEQLHNKDRDRSMRSCIRACAFVIVEICGVAVMRRKRASPHAWLAHGTCGRYKRTHLQQLQASLLLALRGVERRRLPHVRAAVLHVSRRSHRLRLRQGGDPAAGKARCTSPHGLSDEK